MNTVSFHQPLGMVKKSLKRYNLWSFSIPRCWSESHTSMFPSCTKNCVKWYNQHLVHVCYWKKYPNNTSKMGWGWSDGVKIASATKDEGDHCTLGPASIIDSLDLCRGGMLDLFVITEEVRTRNVVFERGVHFVGMIHLDSLYLLYCCTALFVSYVFSATCDLFPNHTRSHDAFEDSREIS